MNINDVDQNRTAPGQESRLSFAQRQFKQLKNGGWATFVTKGRTLLRLLPALIPLLAAFPVVLFARLVRPAVLIRFGPIRSDRIGHFGPETELYLCEREQGKHGHKALDLFYYRGSICNQQLAKMWSRTISINGLVRWPDILNRHLPGGRPHLIPRRTLAGQYDVHNVLEKTPPRLSFSPEEEQFGQQALEEMGIPNGVPFVCFAARDTTYLTETFPEQDFRYHDYRNSKIGNYIYAAKAMVDRGYYAIRMGATVATRLDTHGSGIIDYAGGESRSDFLDIYLAANCRMFIGSADGITGTPLIFRRPISMVNFIPLGDLWLWSDNHLSIPKKLWLRREHRFMTVGEITDSDVRMFVRTEQYDRLEIEVIENTPEEIASVVIEMDDRLSGTWPTSEEDEELQNRFWSVYRSNYTYATVKSRIGAQFLRENRNLLD